MKNLLLILSLFSNLLFFCQEELNPILFQKSQKTINKRSNCGIDSTFIYTSDTLSLPFFDDFSKNHFQQYVDDYANPTITSQKFYSLTDLSNIPLDKNSRFTTQQTIKRTYNVNELTSTSEVLPSTSIKKSDLCSYPPSYEQLNVYPPYILYDTIGFPNDIDTIWLSEVDIIQDSATQFFAQLNDKNAYWLDSKATHNYTNAINPRTFGVVSFDGTDENGMPYQFGSFSNTFNDYLTSKPINLSSFDLSDNLYISFLYQAQGFNEAPEESDSLRLEFYAPDLQQWFRIWSVSGSNVSPFKIVHIPINQTKFIKSTFQFRFINYGSPAGSIDQFHLDYVRLINNSNMQDTIIKDFSIVYPLNSLLKNYTQIPWDHYKNSTDSLLNDSLIISLMNSSNVDENYQNGTIQIFQNNILDGQISLPGEDLANGDDNYFPNSFYFSTHNLRDTSINSYSFNKTINGDLVDFDVSFTATAQFSNYDKNDTCTYKQRFYDSYAYDDGSAEAAYGPTGVQARLAYKFTALEIDSLVGVKMKFLPSVNDVSEDLFLLTVWSDNNGKPGVVLYQDEFFDPRTPSYTYDDSLGFTNYYFKDFVKVPVNETFYVGWRQIDQRALNIGFDANTNTKDFIFYSVDNENSWVNSEFDGSLLIRPIISCEANKTLNFKTLIPRTLFNIYPNPSKDIINISYSNNIQAEFSLYSLLGSKIFDIPKNEKTFSIKELPKGLYILKDNLSGISTKIIKE